MDNLTELQNKVAEFRDERDWKKYHNPKDLCLSISLEAAELLELFQWRDDGYQKERLEEEMADVMIYLLSLADVADIDLGDAVLRKLDKNKKKYPVNTSTKRF